MLYCLLSNWVHVMNHQPRIDLVTRNSQVATVVTSNDESSNLHPFLGLVEPLIDPAIEAERVLADLAAQLEIPIALFERVQTNKL